MKNNICFIIILLSIMLGCSLNELEDPSIELKINNIYPSVGKIGDTITITGSNLDKLSYIYFNHDDISYKEFNTKVNSYSFISRSSEKITLTIPKLVCEKITIFVPNIGDFKFDLVGFIPLTTEFENSFQIQVLNENIAFLREGKKLYKSSDGYYNWNLIIEFTDKFIHSFFFLDEYHGWIGVGSSSQGQSIYYTEDGGNNFTLKFNTSSPYEGSQIRKIQFLSLTRGFFIDFEGNMFITDNDTFENIYEYYPNLNLLPFGQIELWDFNAINENLIFLSPNREYFLIKIDGTNVSVNEFNIQPSEAPQFFDEVGFLQVHSDTYKSTNFGDSWTKIKTFEGYLPDIYFFNNQVGFTFVNFFPPEIFITKNSGISWENYFTFPRYENAHSKDFAEKIGLIGSYNGKLWKYIEE